MWGVENVTFYIRGVVVVIGYVVVLLFGVLADDVLGLVFVPVDGIPVVEGEGRREA